MKVFVSWSGEYSKAVAKTLKDWIPCIIQSVEVFYSDDDIEKGDNWDSVLSQELSDCNYGIICLTQSNIMMPWINFEAGALAKSLVSRVSALMIDVNPSDIKGPLSRYQATKIEKDDFYKLIQSINVSCGETLKEDILRRTFDSSWKEIETEWKELSNKYKEQSRDKTKKKVDEELIRSEAIEEMLQLLRQQSVILSSPEKILPEEYFKRLLMQNSKRDRHDYSSIENIIMYIDALLSVYSNSKNIVIPEIIIKIMSILDEIAKITYVRGDEKIIGRLRYLNDRCEILLYDTREPELKYEKKELRRKYENIDINNDFWHGNR